MIRNGKDITQDIDKDSVDVCIIGSGPAGITAAWHLRKAGLKVTLVEGSRDFGTNWKASRADKKKLYAGTAAGLFTHNEPDFLILPNHDYDSPSERERVFGGTSAHWGGQSRPLDPINFEKRPGFPGWPITRAELDPFYSKAAKFCELHCDDFSAETWADILKAEIPRLKDFDTDMYQFVGEKFRNFATRTFDGVTIADSRIDVILNATLLTINHADGAVGSITVASMDVHSKKAKEFAIAAKAFVLACGAVANAQQLLISNVGNDQVGRYFMCHPLAQGSVVRASEFLSADESRLMDGGDWEDKNGVGVTGRFSPTAAKQRELGIGSCWFGTDRGYYFEQAPNPESRVEVMRGPNDRDEIFGQPKVRITWQLSERDEETHRQTTRLFEAALKEREHKVEFASWADVKTQLVVNGHHIGTTRMSEYPDDGVVDANLKVHSLNNLYVAGASVFASAGVSNPTFTIVALSIRLAEHLSGKLKGAAI